MFQTAWRRPARMTRASDEAGMGRNVSDGDAFFS
jgi:hypothetical protein